MRLDLRGSEPPAGKWAPGRERAIPWPEPAEIGGCDALVLVHQTGCVFGTTARQRAQASGDRELARARRLLAHPYHYAALGATGVGQALALWPLRAYTYHANGGNRYAVGLGIEGRWPRFERERAARHLPRPDAAEALVEAAREALAWAVEDLRAAGAALVGIVTHRQTSGDRLADPGEYLLGALAPSAAGLGCLGIPEWVRDDGKPWPREWRDAWAGAGGALSG